MKVYTTNKIDGLLNKKEHDVPWEKKQKKNCHPVCRGNILLRKWKIRSLVRRQVSRVPEIMK